MPGLRRLIIALGLLLATAVMAAPDTLVIEQVRIGRNPDHSRFVLDLSGPPIYSVTTMENPYRLVLDLPRAELGTSLSALSLGATPVKNITEQRGDDNSLRLNFVLADRMEPRVFTLKPFQQGGDRLVIDFFEPAPSGEANTLVEESEEPAIPPEPSAAVYADADADAKATLPAPEMTNKPRAQTVSNSPIEFSGTWEQEWAVQADGLAGQKFESIVEPRADVQLPHDMQLTAIGRLRLDSVGYLGPDADRPDNYSGSNGPWFNSKHAEFSLRELYLDAQWGDTFLRLGKQQVVWGQADGIKVLDVVNPQSFREFIMDDFDDSRLPLWMINAEIPTGDDSSLQLLWIPDTTYHELAEPGTPYNMTSPLLVPQAPPGIATAIRKADKPDDIFSDSDAGLRYSAFVNGWDLTLNYLYHYQDSPVLYQQLQLQEGNLTATLIPEYERNNLLGATFSNVFGNLTLRAELAYSTDTFHMSSDPVSRGIAESREFSSVMGLDWQRGSDNSLMSLQWFQSHLLDYERDIVRENTEHNVSFLYSRSYKNETWRVKALTLYSINHEDYLLQLKLSYLWRSNVDIWLGGDIFGGDRDGLYGQFANQDRILFGMEWGF